MKNNLIKDIFFINIILLIGTVLIQTFVVVLNQYTKAHREYILEGEIYGHPTENCILFDENDFTSKHYISIRTDSGPRTISCISTNCKTLFDGQIAEFTCFKQVHLYKPPEEHCALVQVKNEDIF